MANVLIGCVCVCVKKNDMYISVEQWSDETDADEVATR